VYLHYIVRDYCRVIKGARDAAMLVLSVPHEDRPMLGLKLSRAGTSIAASSV
jgi:hypothetical protein